MNTTVDGEFQRYTVESGAYIREHFFGPDPRLRELVEHLSDDELRNCPRRPRLPQALRRLQGRRRARGAPTVILAKTVKGWTPRAGPLEGRNATHQIKKLNGEQLKLLCATGCTSRTRSPRTSTPTSRPTTGRRRTRPEYQYLMEPAPALDGPLPPAPPCAAARRCPSRRSPSSRGAPAR